MKGIEKRRDNFPSISHFEKDETKVKIKKKGGRLNEKFLHPRAMITRARLMHDVTKATLKCHSAGGHGGTLHTYLASRSYVNSTVHSAFTKSVSVELTPNLHAKLHVIAHHRDRTTRYI